MALTYDVLVYYVLFLISIPFAGILYLLYKYFITDKLNLKVRSAENAAGSQIRYLNWPDVVLGTACPLPDLYPNILDPSVYVNEWMKIVGNHMPTTRDDLVASILEKCLQLKEGDELWDTIRELWKKYLLVLAADRQNITESQVVVENKKSDAESATHGNGNGAESTKPKWQVYLEIDMKILKSAASRETKDKIVYNFVFSVIGRQNADADRKRADDEGKRADAGQKINEAMTLSEKRLMTNDVLKEFQKNGNQPGRAFGSSASEKKKVGENASDSDAAAANISEDKENNDRAAKADQNELLFNGNPDADRKGFAFRDTYEFLRNIGQSEVLMDRFVSSYPKSETIIVNLQAIQNVSDYFSNLYVDCTLPPDSKTTASGFLEPYIGSVKNGEEVRERLHSMSDEVSCIAPEFDRILTKLYTAELGTRYDYGREVTVDAYRIIRDPQGEENVKKEEKKIKRSIADIVFHAPIGVYDKKFHEGREKLICELKRPCRASQNYTAMYTESQQQCLGRLATHLMQHLINDGYGHVTGIYGGIGLVGFAKMAIEGSENPMEKLCVRLMSVNRCPLLPWGVVLLLYALVKNNGNFSVHGPTKPFFYNLEGECVDDVLHFIENQVKEESEKGGDVYKSAWGDFGAVGGRTVYNLVKLAQLSRQYNNTKQIVPEGLILLAKLLQLPPDSLTTPWLPKLRFYSNLNPSCGEEKRDIGLRYESLGQGGFGCVVKVTLPEDAATGAPRLYRKVALKIPVEAFRYDYNFKPIDVDDDKCGQKCESETSILKFLDEIGGIPKVVTFPYSVSLSTIIFRVGSKTVDNDLKFFCCTAPVGKPLNSLILEANRQRDVLVRLAANVQDAIVSILKAIHAKKVLHLDIRPENIIWKDNKFYLIDFGLALQMVDGMDVTVNGFHGSRLYCHPKMTDDGATCNEEFDFAGLIMTLTCILTSGIIQWRPHNKFQTALTILMNEIGIIGRDANSCFVLNNMLMNLLDTLVVEENLAASANDLDQIEDPRPNGGGRMNAIGGGALRKQHRGGKSM